MITLSELARTTGLELAGDGSLSVSGPAEPGSARPDQLALAMDQKFEDALATSVARAAVVWQGADWQAMGLQGVLFAGRPRVALAHLTGAFQHPTGIAPGIHPSAVIHESAEIGPDAAIGPLTVVGAGARIGARAQIGAQVSIGYDATIGSDALIHDGVRIGAQCTIGDEFIAQPNAVIGADGFSFEPPQRGNAEAARTTGSVATATTTPRYLRIHSLAPVEIGDNVEIGAVTTVDRGTIEPTRIGSGTKIDNQVQVGHNVQIGQTCLICAQVGLAGSAHIGDRVVLGGKVGVGDHIRIGSDAVCAAGALVASNIPPNAVMMGAPATPREKMIEQIMAVKRLPRLARQVAEIRQKLGL